MDKKPMVMDFDDEEEIESSELPTVWSEDEPQGIIFDKMIEGMSNKDYHAVDGVSSTRFKLMRISMSAYDDRAILSDFATFADLLNHEYMDAGFKELAKEYLSEDEMSEFLWKPNPAFATGNLYHDCVLLPRVVRDGYVESSTIGLDTGATDALRAKYPDKIVVAKGAIKSALKAAGMVFRKYGKFIVNSKREVSFFHRCKITDLVFKFRPDIFYREDGYAAILDLKSSQSKNHKEFLKELELYDYDLSAAWYHDSAKLCGYPIDAFYWIIVPKSEPHLPFAFRCTEELLEKGRSKYQTLLADYMQYKEDKVSGIDQTLFKDAYSYAYRRENNANN